MKLADAHLNLFQQGYSSSYGTAWANTREVEINLSPVLDHDSFAQTIDALFQFNLPARDLHNIMHANLMRLIRNLDAKA